MSKSIVVSFNLNPPAGVDCGSLERNKEIKIPVSADPASSGVKEYYTSLRVAIEDARQLLGDDLTAWRDAVGKKELSKETKKSMTYGADEDEDEED